MKIPKTADAVGKIDDELIVSATECKDKSKIKPLLKWGSFAACFATIVIIGISIIPSFLRSDTTKNNSESKYKELWSNETAIIWPWEYLTPAEKYIELNIDNIKYIRFGSAIAESGLKDFIGTYPVFGYDEYTDETPSKEFDVYSLKYADISQFVAVEIENEYFAFKNDTYSPPSTLGKLFDLVDLEKAVELNRFSENGDLPDTKHFTLNDDDFIWKTLKECKSAPFIENQEWNELERNYLSFTISSDTLGFYKLAMYITEDGYLWTNAFSWQYLFKIGEDTAQKIIKYAKENCKETEYEPYNDFDFVAGKITKITDEYFIIDDSVVCKNPNDGTTYKIMLNSIYISRYFDIGEIKLGDIVKVHYTGNTDPTKNNTINDATTINEVTIEDGEMFIDE